MGQRFRAFVARQWAQVTTKAGAALKLVSLAAYAVDKVAPQYAQFDTRIAFAGMAAGVALIAFQQKGPCDAA